MAGEVQIAYGLTGKTPYFTVRELSSGTPGEIWSTVAVAFVAYSTTDFSNYDTSMSEQGTASGVYVGTFPSSISAGLFSVVVRDRAGGSPAESDTMIGSGTIHWSGSAVEEPSVFVSGTDTVDVGKISGDAGAADNLERMLEGVQIGTSDSATFTPTTTVFETDLTEASDDHYNDQALIWGAGAANAGLTFFVTDSQGTTANSNNKVKLTVQTMPNAPADDDPFEIVGTKGS